MAAEGCKHPHRPLEGRVLAVLAAQLKPHIAVPAPAGIDQDAGFGVGALLFLAHHKFAVASGRTPVHPPHGVAGAVLPRHHVVVVTGRSSSLCHVPPKQARRCVARRRTQGERTAAMQREQAEVSVEATQRKNGQVVSVASCEFRVQSCRMRKKRTASRREGEPRRKSGAEAIYVSEVTYIARIPYFDPSCRRRYPNSKQRGAVEALPGEGKGKGEGSEGVLKCGVISRPQG